MGDKLTFRKKRGQVTIFIILAIMIVVLGVLIYAFYPKLQGGLSETKNPQVFIQSCLEDKIEETVLNLSLQGGSIDTLFSMRYQGYNLEYLCHTGEYYEPCSVRQPFLRKHIESEIENEIAPFVVDCFIALQEDYENKGYQVNLKQGETKVELLPKRVLTTISNNLTISKDGSENYNKFNIVVNNNLYELVAIANSIIKSETLIGEVDTMVYMMIYKDLKVEKYEQTDESTVFIITDKNNENKFQFATRSLAFPTGYGF